jgi:3'(2'), 5'-bisphosphate nucleotidase
VDPLDGTKEFIGKRDEYTINIALIIDHEPVLGVVYAPALKILYFGHQLTGSYKIKTDDNRSTERIINEASRIKASVIPEKIRVVVSKSHLNEETRGFINRLNEVIQMDHLRSFGSSLKLCRIAEGCADIYPRLGPTMEWDIAAGHAVARFADCCVIDLNTGTSLLYNKENLMNPYFLVYNPLLDTAVRSVIGRY